MKKPDKMESLIPFCQHGLFNTITQIYSGMCSLYIEQQLQPVDHKKIVATSNYKLESRSQKKNVTKQNLLVCFADGVGWSSKQAIKHNFCSVLQGRPNFAKFCHIQRNKTLGHPCPMGQTLTKMKGHDIK